MRVGVDATSWLNRRGFGRFARNALTRLVELDPHTTYVLFIDGQSAGEVDLPEGAERRVVDVVRAPSQAAAAGSSRSVRDLLRFTAAARRAELDAFLFPSLYTYFPVVGAPTVVGVHGMTTTEFRELTLPTRKDALFWRMKERSALRRAARLFTVSEAARTALVANLGIRVERVAVVPEAPDPAFRPRSLGEVREALEGLGLPADRPYVLFAGGLSPHKSVETILDAYAMLSEQGMETPPLVLAGEPEADPYLSATGSIRERIEALGLGDTVKLPGFVPDDTLASLYAGATVFVSPSLAEGFGLPPVEAAACGAPTLLSDLPAHRETLGDAALYFPPGDAAGLAAQLRRLLGDAELRHSLSEQGLGAVSRFTWDETAQRLQELVAEVAGGGK